MNSFFDIKLGESRLSLIEKSLKKKKMLACSSDFNNIADYLLVKRYLRRVSEVRRVGNYVVGKVIVKVPYIYIGRLEYGYRPYGIPETFIEKRNNYAILHIPRLLIIGIDENQKLFATISNTYYGEDELTEDNIRHVEFHFDIDMSGHDTIVFDNEELFHRSVRVQGDIAIFVIPSTNVEIDYVNNLIRESRETLLNVLHREIALRIGDILSEIGLNVEIEQDRVIIEGAPKNVSEEKLFYYIAEHLILSDILPNFKKKISLDGYWPHIILDNGDYKCILEIRLDYLPRSPRNTEPMLIIRPHFDINSIDPITVTYIFGKEILRGAEIEEEEQHMRLGRHVIWIERAFPRNIMVEHEFSISGRRYHIMLNVESFFTTNTIVKISHPEHGEKTLKISNASFTFRHVNSPYRTNAIKNSLILQKYFTK